MTAFHDIVSNNDKVFLTGIPGVGKSEFIKTYAKIYRKEYAGIFYFNYTGDLRQMITDADFIDEIAASGNKEEYLFVKNQTQVYDLGFLVGSFSLSQFQIHDICGVALSSGQ